MKIQATIDLDQLGMTLEEWAKFAYNQEWYQLEEIPPWSNHMRDMTQGWQKLCTAKDWAGESKAWEKGWREPGVYALVLDVNDKGLHPVTSNRTVCFGETTQTLGKRVHTHISALKGKISNMTEKWNKYDSVVNYRYDCDIRNNLDKVWIWTRPHKVTDPDYIYNRNHSCYMEQQAMAHYYALWGVFPPANTRDLPYTQQVNEAKETMMKNHEQLREFLTR